MNKFINLFSLILILETSTLLAQNTFPSTGNVGIGTATPSSALTVNGSISTTSQINSTSNTTTLGGVNLSIDAGDAGHRSRAFAFTPAGGSTAFGYIDAVTENGGATSLVIGSGYGGSGDTMYINNKLGNVGIGTTSPGANLDVYGSTMMNGGFRSRVIGPVWLTSGTIDLGYFRSGNIIDVDINMQGGCADSAFHYRIAAIAWGLLPVVTKADSADICNIYQGTNTLYWKSDPNNADAGYLYLQGTEG